MQTNIDICAMRAYFEAHREEILADLFRLASIPSVRSEAVDGKPFGDASYRALFASLELFRQAGFEASLSEDGSYALAFYGGKNIEESVGVFAHTDVVPVGDGWLYTEPFSPILRDECAIGRGVEDNKAGVVIALWALKLLKEKGIVPPRPITVFLGSAEESGMEDIASFTRTHPMPFVSLVPDSDYPVCIGEKGIAHFYMIAKEPFRGVSRLEGGEAFNVVLDRAEAALPYGERLMTALSSMLDGRKDVVLKCHEGNILLSAHGKSAHASTPEGSVNAAHLLCGLLAQCDALDEDDRAVLARAEQILAQTDGSVAGLDIPEPIFSPLTMTNGMVSLRDGHLALSFDIRYGTVLDACTLEEKLSACAEQYGFTLEMHENSAGFAAEKNSPAVLALLDACEAFSGERPLPYLMGGGTYARRLYNAFSVGTTASYVADPYSAPTGHGGAHQPDEHLPIAPFLEAAALVTDMLLRLTSL